MDCGFSARTTLARLDALGVDPASLAGIVVTHEHGDHAGGAARVARRLGIPVLATPGTLAGMHDASGYDRRALAPRRWHRFAGFDVRLFPVPHDAREPTGVRIRHGGHDLAVVTDAGEWDDGIVNEVRDADVLYVESNHDVDLLTRGPYPPALQRRIVGRHGHLSNDACGRLLSRSIGPRTRRVLLGHLSRHNNTPELALATNHALLERAGVAAPDLVAADPVCPVGPWTTG